MDRYILKHYDESLLWFSMQTIFGNLEVEIEKVDQSKKSLLPLDLELTNSSLISWLKRRVIPRKRAYASNFLAKLGLNEKDTKGIIDICQGLSLNDCYWVVRDDCKDTFEKRNLYTNRFNTNIASIAFTGFGSYTKSSFRSSPEFTTNGMLAKSWRRIGDNICLYKSGTEGFANSGLEPYSEIYASQIAKAMDLHRVDYSLSKWKSRMCSSCQLFTSIDVGFIPIGKLVKTGGILKVIRYYQELGDKYYQELLDMLVFDAIIMNEDRHFGNFGLLIDNHTNEIIGPAPIFDNGLSLLCYAMDDDFTNGYIETRMPSTYDDFVSFVKPLMTNRQKQKVRQLLTFKFDTKTTYKLPSSRLKKLEEVIHRQVEALLD